MIIIYERSAKVVKFLQHYSFLTFNLVQSFDLQYSLLKLNFMQEYHHHNQ